MLAEVLGESRTVDYIIGCKRAEELLRVDDESKTNKKE